MQLKSIHRRRARNRGPQPLPSKETTELIAAARQLIADTDRQFIELGRIIRQIRDASADGQFRKVVPDQLGFSLRKAYMLIQVAEAIDSFGVPEQLCHEIGWAKLTVIAAHLDGNNWATLCVLARTMNMPSLETYVRKGHMEDTQSVVLKLARPVRDAFYKALTDAGATRGFRRKWVGLDEALLKLIA